MSSPVNIPILNITNLQYNFPSTASYFGCYGIANLWTTTFPAPPGIIQSPFTSASNVHLWFDFVASDEVPNEDRPAACASKCTLMNTYSSGGMWSMTMGPLCYCSEKGTDLGTPLQSQFCSDGCPVYADGTITPETTKANWDGFAGSRSSSACGSFANNFVTVYYENVTNPFTSDPNNCGTLGNKCETLGHGAITNGFYSCIASTCYSNCSTNYTLHTGVPPLPDTCLNLQNDTGNCGAVGNNCSTVHGALSTGSYSCTAGSCVASCNANLTLANTTVSNVIMYSCYNLTSDINNCGAVGTNCTTAGILQSTSVDCIASSCVATACNAFYYLSSDAKLCVSNNMANLETINFGTSQAPYSASATYFGCLAFGNQTVATALNVSNVTIPTGPVTSPEDCASACNAAAVGALNTSTVYSAIVASVCYCVGGGHLPTNQVLPSANCNTPCVDSPGVAGGVHVSQTCGGGNNRTTVYFQNLASNTFTDCIGGSCFSIDTQTDADHCGSVGYSCDAHNPVVVNGTYSCVAGVCVASCATGLTLLPISPAPSKRSPSTQQCFDLQNDPLNCGTVGTSCSVAHSSAVGCSAGSCVATACLPGYALSNGNAACTFIPLTLPSLVSSNTAFTYSSCMSDPNPSAHILSHALVNTGTGMGTIDSCLALAAAAGYLWVGLENGGDCWASNTAPTGSVLPDSQCNMPCAGNATQSCGNTNVISVYHGASTSLVSYQSGSVNWTYTSCWGEPSPHSLTNRALSKLLIKSRATAELCLFAATQAGYLYAGLEYGGECWGGLDAPLGGAIAESFCNMTCTADSKRPCGGNWALNLYTATPSVDSRFRTISGHSWNRTSCWGEPLPHGASRSLANLVSNGVDIGGCLTLGTAAGYSYCGLEYGGECWCASTAPAGGAIPNSYCNQKCNANPDDFCGGDWALDLWHAVN